MIVNFYNHFSFYIVCGIIFLWGKGQIMKILKVKKATDYKYLNLYLATLKLPNGKVKEYQFASRNKDEKALLNNMKKWSKKPDAVKILPYTEENGKIYVVFIRQFRPPIGRSVYEFPAGLVDEGEDYVVAAKRELKEEIGAVVKSIKQVSNAGYPSTGLSNESIACFVANVELTGKQELEDMEEIEIVKVELKDVFKFLKDRECCVISELLAKLFYYENIK